MKKRNDLLVALIFGIVCTMTFIVPTIANTLKTSDEFYIGKILYAGDEIEYDGTNLSLDYCYNDNYIYYDSSDYGWNTTLKVANLSDIEEEYRPSDTLDGEKFVGWKVDYVYYEYSDDGRIELVPYYENKYKIITQPTASSPSIVVTYPEDVDSYEWIRMSKTAGMTTLTSSNKWNYSAGMTNLTSSDTGMTTLTSSNKWNYSKERKSWYSNDTSTILTGYFDITDKSTKKIPIYFEESDERNTVYLHVTICNTKDNVIYENNIYKSKEIDYSFLNNGTYEIEFDLKKEIYVEGYNNNIYIGLENTDFYTISDVEYLEDEVSSTLSKDAILENKAYMVNAYYKNDGGFLSSNIFEIKKEVANQTIEKEDVINPLTGDNIYLYLVIGFVSTIMVVVIIYKLTPKKKKRKK